MNKQDLIQTLSTTNGLSKTEAAKILNLFFDQMANALEKGDRVEGTDKSINITWNHKREDDNDDEKGSEGD